MHCILFFLLGLCVFVNGDNLNSILSEMEDSLLAHKKTFLDAYMNRCSTTKCQCSRSACYSQFTTEPECRTDFGNNKTSCPLCGGFDSFFFLLFFLIQVDSTDPFLLTL